MNLPKFDPKGNVHTFLRLFEMSMHGATDQDKATTLLNQLDAASTDLIVPHMPVNDWSYAAAKDALLHEFGSVARTTERKNEFLMINFKKDETIQEFADRFYLEAQILTGSGSLTVHDAHIALKGAVKPYETLYRTLLPAFQDHCTLDGMVRYLRQCGDTFGAPNVAKPKPPTAPFNRAERADNNPRAPRPDMAKITCHRCNRKGHYASNCTSKTSINVIPPLGAEDLGKVNVE